MSGEWCLCLQDRHRLRLVKRHITTNRIHFTDQQLGQLYELMQAIRNQELEENDQDPEYEKK